MDTQRDEAGEGCVSVILFIQLFFACENFQNKKLRGKKELESQKANLQLAISCSLVKTRLTVYQKVYIVH